MIAPDIPKNELARIQALESYNILDTLSDQEYDDFTKIAAQICGTPIALISLIDHNRQWFKSRVGLDAPETPRDISFCGHAINTPEELFEVTDSTKDIRFFDNPLVISDPHVIFYLGAPLVTPNGEAIGTLCVIDHQPREISQNAKDTLELLSRQVITKLELRKRNVELENINNQLNVEVENRKKKEQELVIARDQAIQAEKAKDLFLSNMSHEIRTPLNGIIGITQLFLDDQSFPKQHIELFKLVDFSANHLLRVINDILDFSKIKNGKLIFEQIDFNFNQFLENIRCMFSVKAEEKGIRLTLKNDKAIPTIIRGDANRLGQILLNLVGNAVKFTEEGEVALETVLLNQTASTLQIRFDIKDTGIGIPENKLNHVFDQFAQSDNSISRKFGGTGLGLAITKSLIEQFGGTIKVESTLGVGSTFSFSIPFDAGTKEKTPKTTFPVCPPEQYGVSKKNLNILLVEDDHVNQKIAQKQMEKHSDREQWHRSIKCVRERSL